MDLILAVLRRAGATAGYSLQHGGGVPLRRLGLRRRAGQAPRNHRAGATTRLDRSARFFPIRTDAPCPFIEGNEQRYRESQPFDTAGLPLFPRLIRIDQIAEPAIDR